MKGATTPNRGSGDNLLQNPPEQLLLRQSIMKRIGRSKDSNTNTITSFKRQQSNQLSQSQSQATAGGYSPPVPRIPQIQIPTIVRMSDVKGANVISTADSSYNNNPKTSTLEPMAICKFLQSNEFIFLNMYLCNVSLLSPKKLYIYLCNFLFCLIL